MEEAFEEFIDERINNEYARLRKSTKWKDSMQEFNTLYSKLSEVEKNKLDELLAIKDCIINYESIFAYKLGIQDTFKILNFK